MPCKKPVKNLWKTCEYLKFTGFFTGKLTVFILSMFASLYLLGVFFPDAISGRTSCSIFWRSRSRGKQMPFLDGRGRVSSAWIVGNMFDKCLLLMVFFVPPQPARQGKSLVAVSALACLFFLQMDVINLNESNIAKYYISNNPSISLIYLSPRVHETPPCFISFLPSFFFYSTLLQGFF